MFEVEVFLHTLQAQQNFNLYELIPGAGFERNRSVPFQISSKIVCKKRRF